MEEYKDPDTLRELYWEKEMTLSDISEKLDCGLTTVYKWMKQHDIPRRKSKQEIEPRPRTLPSSDTNPGYEVIRHNGESLLHHRLIAVAEYGFDEIVGRDVHHQNGIRWDNRTSNLELLEHGEHSSLHRLNEHDEAPWRDEEVLRKYYVEQKWPTTKIAEEWGCSSSTIHEWLKKFDIETRQSGKPSQRNQLLGDSD